MKILFVSEFFYPKIGGGEKWTEDVACALAERGHDVFIVTSRLPHTKELEKYRGLRIYRHSSSGSFLQRLRMMRELEHYLTAFIKQHKIDIVHTNAYTPTLPAARAAKKNNIPVVSSVHLAIGTAWFRLVHPPAAFINWTLENYSIARTPHSAVHVTAEATKKRFAKFTRAPINVIYNFLEEERFARIYRKVNVAQVRKKYKVKGKFILSVGSLVKVKNLRTTIRQVIKAHEQSGEQMTFLIAGRGSERDALQRLIDSTDKQGLDIRLIGEISETEKLELMASCDLFIVLSYSEQFCLVLLEALAFDRYAIATKVGGIRDIAKSGVTNKTRFLDDASQAADAIIAVPSNQKKRFNKRVFTVYSKKKVIDAFIALYEKLRS